MAEESFYVGFQKS